MSESATEYRYPQEQDQEQPNTDLAEGVASAEADMGQVKETYEDTRVIIRNVIAGLAPRAQSDHSFIERTSGIMRRMDSTRTIELNRLAEEEKQVTSTLKRIQQERVHQTTRLRALGYQQKVSEYQKESMELAKEMSELETNSNWASGELSKLRKQLADLEARNVAQELPVGPDVLQLQLMKQAGFHHTANGDLLIRSSNDVHIMQVDPNVEGFEQAQELWQKATGPDISGAP